MLPMIEVFRPKEGKYWEGMHAPINNTDKIEWFDSLVGWPRIKGVVNLDGREKKMDIFLSEADRGWINWDDFDS
jgi:hypothetical protein